MTLPWSNSLEEGDFSAWSGTAGSGWTVVQANAHHGSWSARGLEPTGDPTGSYKDVGANLGNVRAYFKLATAAAGGGISLIGMTQAASPGSETCFAEIQKVSGTDYKITGRYRANDGWHYAEGNITCNTGEYHYIEIRWVRSATVGEFRVYYDDTEIITVTGLANDGRTSDAATIGNWEYADPTGYDVNVDCFVASNTHIGPEAAAGEELHVNQYTQTARNDWAKVGTAPYLDAIDYPTNYIHDNIDGHEIGDFDFEDSAETTVPLSVLLKVHCRKETSGGTIKVYIDPGTGFVEAGTITPDAVWADKELDVSSIVDAYEKVNAAKMDLKHLL
jgi:hypothetical protein